MEEFLSREELEICNMQLALQDISAVTSSYSLINISLNVKKGTKGTYVLTEIDISTL